MMKMTVKIANQTVIKAILVASRKVVEILSRDFLKVKMTEKERTAMIAIQSIPLKSLTSQLMLVTVV